MVEGGRRDFSLHRPDPRGAADVATQEVAAEHVAEGDDKDLSECALTQLFLG